MTCEMHKRNKAIINKSDEYVLFSAVLSHDSFCVLTLTHFDLVTYVGFEVGVEAA